MILTLRWRAPERPVATRWRGPEGMLAAITRNPSMPIAAIIGVSSGGDITGPVNSIDKHVPVFDGTSGKVLKHTSVKIDEWGNMASGAYPSHHPGVRRLVWGGSAGDDGELELKYGAGGTGVLAGADGSDVAYLHLGTNDDALNDLDYALRITLSNTALDFRIQNDRPWIYSNAFTGGEFARWVTTSGSPCR